MTHRIKEYQRTIFHPENGLTTDLFPFTEDHIIGMDIVLELDGLLIADAIRVIRKWNNIAMRYPRSSGVQYNYSIPFIKKEYSDA
jgi:hypothetical protein